MSPDKLTFFIESIVILFFAIGIHEYAHCKFADMAGDPTPGIYGRVTLNLFKHMDPVGSVIMIISCWVGFGFGWGKPSPIDPRKMRNPRLDTFIAVLAGPVSNLCQAFIFAALMRITKLSAPPELQQFFYFGVLINVELALFNLIPIFPLDGHWLVGLILPQPQQHQWFQFQKRLGIIGVIALLFYLQGSQHNFLYTGIDRISSMLIGGR